MSRQSAGPRRPATAAVPTFSATVTRAISGPRPGRDLSAGGHRGQGNHLHRIVAETHPLEGDAVDGTVIFADPAVGAAVVVDEDLAGLATELLAEHGVADLDEAAARGVPVFASVGDAQCLARAALDTL